ncbi:MAG: polysaccharide deacetylase family protein [Clostridiales bacterium]|nr:polysaccharide deacetylase family protein [Clostridiales bacterium]
MKRRRPWLAIILGSSLLTIIAIDIYLLLTFEFPARMVPEPTRPPVVEPQQIIGQTPITKNEVDAVDDNEKVDSNDKITDDEKIDKDEKIDNGEKINNDKKIDKDDKEENPHIVGSEPEDLDSTNNDVQVGQSPGSDNYVREVPIQLDTDMENHLQLFRNNARMLVQEFPQSFMITMNSSDFEASDKTIALTFDDGPDSSTTMEVVNILNEYGIPGTFFLIGQQVDSYPNTIKAILDGGHTIANHSWSHMRPTDISTDILMNETDKAQEAISNYNVTTKLYRPPYGLVKRTQMPALREAGYKVVSWSIDSMDWYFTNSEQIVKCVVDNAHPGAIVLMHSAGGSDNRKATLEALPIIIETLQEEGYRFISLR